jgi:DNA adenine methylase
VNILAPLKSPYPWFGGKSRAAGDVWQAFGVIKNYVEPFFGSGAVLLSRPDFDPEKTQVETISDVDGFVANFWRATQADPESVAYYADNPVNEIDLHARHGWLINRRERLLWSLEDPDFYDAKIAGWWVWGVSCWIAGGFCSGAGPWRHNGAHLVNSRKEEVVAGQGVNRQLPHLGNAGSGVNRQLPHLGNAGRGINRKGGDLAEYITALADRMRNVRVCCGDWSRVTGPSVTEKLGITGVFLDPPYSVGTGRDMGCYPIDSGTVAHDVRAWCIEHGDNSKLRIVLCGYDGEHDMPESWRCIEGKATNGARGGYGVQRKDGTLNANGGRERMWLSPACHDVEELGPT